MVWPTYYSRGNNGDDHDNNRLIEKMLTLRHERVNLLGYENYSLWRLQDPMAKTPQNAMDLMQKVWPAAIARVAEELADMQALADAQGVKISIEAWDYRYSAQQVPKSKYDLASDEVKQYRLREDMF